MSSGTIEAPQLATGTDAVTILPDRKQLQQFVFNNSTELRELCHDAGKHRLFFSTPDAILGTLFRSLHRYGGPSVEEEFMQWARRFVSREAARFEITGRILTEYEDLIFAAIRDTLWKSAVDYAVEPKDIFWEVAFLIFQRAHSLNRPGTAKLSSRLHALVKKHVYLYYNKKNAQRRKLVQLHKNEIQCECFSDEELAAMRAAESDNTTYNPGYAEVGLSLI